MPNKANKCSNLKTPTPTNNAMTTFYNTLSKGCLFHSLHVEHHYDPNVVKNESSYQRLLPPRGAELEAVKPPTSDDLG